MLYSLCLKKESFCLYSFKFIESSPTLVQSITSSFSKQ